MTFTLTHSSTTGFYDVDGSEYTRYNLQKDILLDCDVEHAILEYNNEGINGDEVEEIIDITVRIDCMENTEAVDYTVIAEVFLFEYEEATCQDS